MAFRIGIEDLVANALIENLSQDTSKKFVSYDEIESYGAKVVKILMDEQEDVTLLLSRLKTSQMLQDYSNYFEEKKIDGALGVQLKDDITLEALCDLFRGYLSIRLLSALIRGYKES